MTMNKLEKIAIGIGFTSVAGMMASAALKNTYAIIASLGVGAVSFAVALELDYRERRKIESTRRRAEDCSYLTDSQVESVREGARRMITAESPLPRVTESPVNAAPPLPIVTVRPVDY